MADEPPEQAGRSLFEPARASSPHDPNLAAITAAGIVSLLVLALALAIVLVLVVMAANEWLGVFPDDPMVAPKLLWPWSFFIWLVLNGGLVAKLSGGLAALLALGIKVIAERTMNVWPAVLILLSCLVGFVLSLALMWLISEPNTFRTLRGFANATGADFKASVDWSLGLLAVWFLGFAQRQVGLKREKEILSNAYEFIKKARK